MTDELTMVGLSGKRERLCFSAVSGYFENFHFKLKTCWLSNRKCTFVKLNMLNKDVPNNAVIYGH